MQQAGMAAMAAEYYYFSTNRENTYTSFGIFSSGGSHDVILLLEIRVVNHGDLPCAYIFGGTILARAKKCPQTTNL